MLFRNDKKDDKEPTSGPTRVPLLPLRDIIVFPHPEAKPYISILAKGCQDE